MNQEERQRRSRDGEDRNVHGTGRTATFTGRESRMQTFTGQRRHDEENTPCTKTARRASLRWHVRRVLCATAVLACARERRE
ncbi:uncharacterized protein DS421_3g83060 [Arachis hypogaea]|nr:uncharacterized protein DS421_3g83060 [Arachis hypogaea]